MSMFYRMAYALGFAPWERAATHPPAVEHIVALFEREERGRQPPYGKALDLGCGRGHWSIVLARRGWEVTGIDLVPRAVAGARKRARDAGVDAEIVVGDVTELRDSVPEDGFRLIWDFGTLHGLPQSQRHAVAREIDAVAAEDASILMLAWAPARRGPLPRGASRVDIEGAFGDWKVIDDEPFDVTGLPRALRKVSPRVYRLGRT